MTEEQQPEEAASRAKPQEISPQQLKQHFAQAAQLMIDGFQQSIDRSSMLRDELSSATVNRAKLEERYIQIRNSASTLCATKAKGVEVVKLLEALTQLAAQEAFEREARETAETSVLRQAEARVASTVAQRLEALEARLVASDAALSLGLELQAPKGGIGAGAALEAHTAFLGAVAECKRLEPTAPEAEKQQTEPEPKDTSSEVPKGPRPIAAGGVPSQL